LTIKRRPDSVDVSLVQETIEMVGEESVPRVVKANVRITLYIVAIYLAAFTVALGLASSNRSGRGFFAPAWGVLALAALFAISEFLVVHFQVGRSAHTVSVVEATLVISIFHSSSLVALLSQLLGCGLVLVLHRKQRSSKLLFNLGMFALENQLAVAVFRAVGAKVGAKGMPSLSSWIAAYAAAGAFTLTGTVLVFGVIYLAEDELSTRDLVNTIKISLLNSGVMVSVGLSASALLAVSPATAVLLAIPIAGAFATNRTFLRERRRGEELEFLRQSSARLLGDDAAERTLWSVLEAARAEFRVERVDYEYRDADAQGWKRVSFRRGEAPVVVVFGGSELSEICPVSSTIVDVGSEVPDSLTREIAAREFGSTAIVVPVRVRDAIEGVLLIGQPSTDIATFGPDDLRLADMLASQLSSAVENGRLEQSVAELRSLESKLVFELQHDGLTGLLNRGAFARRVRETISRVSGDRTNAVVFLDLDDFKPINDTYGHAAGDRLLKVIGERLLASIRPHDLAARFGGDEFAVFLSPISNREEAAVAANRLLLAISQPIELVDGEYVTPGASIGVAIASKDDTLESILERADAAMFQAKNQGKGHVEVLDPAMNQAIRRAYALELSLSEAVDRNELELAFQSVHRLDDRSVVAYECLVRWNHPEHGILSPDEFMPSGLRADAQRGVRRFVSEEAGRALGRLTAAGYGGPLSVNLGAGQALDDTLLDDLTALFRATTVGSDRLLIEIAEMAFQRSPETMVRRTEDLRVAGASIVLDDLSLDRLTFGLVEKLKPAQVKLSRTLVSELSQRPGAKSFVRAIVELGRSVGYEVVAKGVEDAATAEQASELGCAFGQGYLFARPASLDAILPLLAPEGGTVAILQRGRDSLAVLEVAGE
jgi:diguanylate cyclase (GGDEF)-like protein